jgi:glycosyltransferase involved in cell wall biosynthesis
MKVGILGCRGIPNVYGGFEQFAQFLAPGLCRRGHDVWVYNSRNHPYRGDQWQGVRLLRCSDPEPTLGAVGQFLYDLNCFRDAAGREFDILLQLGYTSSSIWNKSWPKGPLHFISMDGLEWNRGKYHFIARRFLRHAEALAVRNADGLIADSTVIRKHLRERYGREATYIPYGASVFQEPDLAQLSIWGLRAKEYILAVARMEPENNLEMIIQGYILSGLTYPLVLVGNLENRHGRRLKNRYGKRVRFVGSIYDEEQLNNLRYFSLIYLHGHSVGGTNPSLLEAMGCSCQILAHGNPFNEAILGVDAEYFLDESELGSLLRNRAENPWEREANIHKNLEKIRSLYPWDDIVGEYESLFFRALSKHRGKFSSLAEESVR